MSSISALPSTEKVLVRKFSINSNIEAKVNELIQSHKNSRVTRVEVTEIGNSVSGRCFLVVICLQ